MDFLRNVMQKTQARGGYQPTTERNLANMWYVPVFVLLGITTVLFFAHGFMTGPELSQKQVSSSADGFVATADYLGDKNWSFTVNGNVSNQCVTSDVAIDESEPESETVTVRLIAYRPIDETLCAQRVKNIFHEGTFIASRDTKINLKIDQRESKKSPTGLEPKNI